MGNTLGCSIFCARPRVQTNKKCLVNNKLENRKKNLLKKRPKSNTENVTRQQDTEEKEDIKYQAFLQNCFQVMDDERNAQDNHDSEINSDILHDGYMKVSDFKRFVEENFHALDKQKSRKQLQAFFSDSVECKLPDTVQGFFVDDESNVITMEEEELTNDGNKGQPNIRNVSLNKTTGKDKSTNGEDDNQEPTKENKKKSAFERDNSYSREERKLSHSTQHGKEDRRHEKNNSESVCFSNGNEEHLKENITNTPGLMAIPDSSGSNSESKSEYCEHVNIKQSESMYSDHSTSRQDFNHEHWYMSIASYANSAKNFTISRLHMKDEKVNATFMSLPNLSEIRYNPEYQNQHMKESVFPEATEVYSYSLSELSSSERETNADRMEELKRNSSTISSETNDSSADSGRSSNVTDFSRTKRVRSGYTRYLCNPDCSLCYAAQIEYMVEVYEPLIVRQIKVTDILEFLPFIDERNKEMLRSKHLQSSHEAMEMLIKIIMKSDATGKWQSFLDAIYETGKYSTLVSYSKYTRKIKRL
ncbi:uncharacterized protein LOC123538573 isoform X2 [Mercenaria mercenaria]|uniref:uncharacterized protein LOC123538573 isoform X2 n=1 Tax=Mercenaria mercenaria TaxID=6596 RepID=UPI00234F5E0F|nr:uncharacterized protein LOC123538573 isoform X2 [Mercenaria mercenaria]